MSDDNWKQKYLNSLDQREKNDAERLTVETLLKQGLSRAALAAEGIDNTLDNDLRQIRKVLRKDIVINHLESAVENLTLSVQHLDDERRDESSSSQSPQQLLSTWVDSLSLPKPLKKRMSQLRKKIDNTQNLSEMESPLRELAELMNEALLQNSKRANKNNDSFFGRLFNKSSDDVPLVVAPAQNDYPSPKIEDFCIQLLDTLSLPNTLRDQVEALKDTFEKGLPDNSVAPALSAIANLISAMNQQMSEENKELQTFLEQLGDNLKDIDQNLSGAQNSHRESINNSRNFDNVVQTQVSDIEHTVENEPGSSQLKEKIQSRLNAIRKHLNQYRQSEETHQQTLEKQLAQLNSRLQGMENESKGLRQRLQQKHQQAIHDPLTHLHNRLAYDERINQELIRCKRYEQPLVLMVIDIDHFKRVNDSYGHKAGDKALILIATQIKNNLRESDFLARYGGEEFVLLMLETNLESAAVAADKLLKAVEKCEFHYQNQKVGITISAGLAQFRKEDTADSLFQRADEAMYRAKQAGRNQCQPETAP
jgi:diguanylate cyclase